MAAIRGNPDKIPEVDDFIKANLTFAMMKGVEPYIGLPVKGGEK